jgi:hypothetical protein
LKNYFAGSKVEIVKQDMKIRRLVLKFGLPIVIIVLVDWLVVASWQSVAHPHPHVLPQFAKADRVVLGWGTWESTPEIIVMGEKAREIVHLVTTAKRITDTKGRPEPIGIMLLNEARFYQGTNYLGRLATSCGLFSTGGMDGYEADKEKMESLIDNPIQKELEKQQGKAQAIPL